MRNYARVLTIAAVILAGGVIAGNAQMMPTPDQPQSSQREQDTDTDGCGMMGHGAMMGHGGMGHGMMGRGMMRHGMIGHRGMVDPFAMRMIFALIDSDGDGTISPQEWQAAHEKIFKAMDPDKDGTVTLEEMMNFMRGSRAPMPQGR